MLTVHRAERADVLARVLAEHLATPLADPMATEVVAVPARGVERWLQQQLARNLGAAGHDDGIAANIDYASGHALLQRAVLPTADDPEAAERWYTDDLVWPVLRVLDAQLADPRLRILARHLGAGGESVDDGSEEWRRGRRYGAAATIAGMFAGYGWQRPAMIADWAAEHDTDGAGGELPEALRWQPWFWRLVREEVGQPHLAEQLPAVVDRLRAEPGLVDLPERLALFGATRIPAAQRAVLGALAAHRDVSLYLPHPSDALWRSVAAAPTTVPRARGIDGEIRPDHPLLAALSRDVREMQEVLAPSIDEDVYHRTPGPALATLLSAVQDGVRRDRLDGGPVPVDDSLEVHACHGPERQVEVLRDRLLRLFDDHPDLEPRDVLIMCPDVETFAPLIAGAFGQAGLEHPGFGLRVRLADRGLRETNEILDVLDTVATMAADRVRSGDLLGLLGLPAVRRRFGFTDEDGETLAGWVERAGIRWGIDRTQRERFGLGGFPQGTAAAGRDRVLLGVLAEEAENQWLGVGLPLEGVESTKIDLAGRFAELIDRLGALLTAMDAPHSAREWNALLTRAIDQLTAPGPDTVWQRAQAVGMIAGALGPAADGIELGLTDVRELLRRLLAARPTRSNFCTGELTVCTLTPMRSVPHRAVILLGLDAEVFPRATTVDGDDVLALKPLVGERDRRDEDRQVFLDALGAAIDHLLIFYTGSDPVTGAVIPPPVVVSELVETADRVVGGPSARRAADSPVVHRHTLHAFDARNFLPVDGAAPRSYDRRLLGGAQVLSDLAVSGEVGERAVPMGRLVLPAPPTADVDLDELVAFFDKPLARFVRQRLGAALPEVAELHPDQLDVTLDNLQSWKIGDRYLQGLLGGGDPDDLRGAELRRGALPPFGFGIGALHRIEAQAQAVGRAALSLRVGDPDAVDVGVRLADGRRLYGTVSDVFGNRLLVVNYSTLGAKHRLAAWIRLLAIAAGSSRPVDEAVVVGAAWGDEPGARISRLAVPPNAADLLEQLIAIRDAGLRSPLWLPPRHADSALQAFSRRGLWRSADSKLRESYAKSKFPDEYAGLVIHDDPLRKPAFDDLIALAESEPFAELDPLLPRSPDPDAPRWMRLAAAVFAPLHDREEGR